MLLTSEDVSNFDFSMVHKVPLLLRGKMQALPCKKTNTSIFTMFYCQYIVSILSMFIIISFLRESFFFYVHRPLSLVCLTVCILCSPFSFKSSNVVHKSVISSLSFEFHLVNVLYLTFVKFFSWFLAEPCSEIVYTEIQYYKIMHLFIICVATISKEYDLRI